MPLPVIPKSPGVILQRWHGNAQPFERSVRLAAVDVGRVVDEGQHVFRQAQVLHDRVTDAPHRRQCDQALFDGLGDEPQQRGVDEQVHPRRVRGATEDIQHIADTQAVRVHQMKAARGDAGLVADVVEGIDHKIDRHEVDPPAFQADHGHPRRQQLAHALDQLEKIVRTVDLVHLAAAAVAHHQRRAVHRPG